MDSIYFLFGIANIGIVMKKWIMNKLITGPIFGSQEKWTVEAFHTLNSGPGTMVNRLWSTQLGIQNHICVPWTQLITKLFARSVIEYLMKPQNFLAALDLFLGHNNIFFVKVSILKNCGEKKEDVKIACWNCFFHVSKSQYFFNLNSNCPERS